MWVLSCLVLLTLIALLALHESGVNATCGSGTGELPASFDQRS